jgi:hypothetical protein
VHYVMKKSMVGDDDVKFFYDAEKKDIPYIKTLKRKVFTVVNWDWITLSDKNRLIISNNTKDIDFELRKLLELKYHVRINNLNNSACVGVIERMPSFQAEEFAEDLFNLLMSYINPKQPEDCIIGKWFHSFGENGKVKWQGQVTDKAPDNHFMIQLYSWVSGNPIEQKLLKFSDMTNWHFYPSNKDMFDAYERLKSQKLAD